MPRPFAPTATCRCNWTLWGRLRQGIPRSRPKYYGLEENDLRRLPASLIGGPVGAGNSSAWEALQALRAIYGGHIGYDYSYIHIPEERDWLREAAESGRFRPPARPLDEVRLLERLTQVEVFELFLNRIFPGRSIFSLSGLDMLIPILDEITRAAVEDGICLTLIGMGHRGRLNVLAHTLQKPYAQILAEFKDPTASFLARVEPGWTGDVKYHKGALGAVEENQAVEMVIQMPPNPSHLEQVDPVLVGMARAANSGMNRPGRPTFYPKAALPVLIHGDASFPGQGIVAETLNLSLLPGYNTAGSLHIIANNQLGYTATESETRSVLYAGDLAKGFKIPVIHVNADDPEACLEAVATGFAYRERFEKDFLIDLVGYRRYGHNEGDEPSYTQPIMYRKIGQHPSVRALWAQTLVERGMIDPGRPDELVNEGMVALQKVLEGLKPEQDLVEQTPKAPPPRAARKINTSVPLKRLQELNQSLLDAPAGFHLHPKLERAMRSRGKALEDPQKASVDWATAEQLAFASILQDGIPIRLTGEDVARGTSASATRSFSTWTAKRPGRLYRRSHRRTPLLKSTTAR